MLKVLYMAVLFCEHSLSVAAGFLHVAKSILKFIDLHMQITELPLHALISIDFNAVDEHGPGALYSILDVNTLYIDFPKTLSPKQVVDILVTTSTSLGMVDGDVVLPSTCKRMCLLPRVHQPSAWGPEPQANQLAAY